MKDKEKQLNNKNLSKIKKKLKVAKKKYYRAQKRISIARANIPTHKSIKKVEEKRNNVIRWNNELRNFELNLANDITSERISIEEYKKLGFCYRDLKEIVTVYKGKEKNIIKKLTKGVNLEEGYSKLRQVVLSNVGATCSLYFLYLYRSFGNFAPFDPFSSVLSLLMVPIEIGVIINTVKIIVTIKEIRKIEKQMQGEENKKEIDKTKGNFEYGKTKEQVKSSYENEKEKEEMSKEKHEKDYVDTYKELKELLKSIQKENQKGIEKEKH